MGGGNWTKKNPQGNLRTLDDVQVWGEERIGEGEGEF